MQPGLLFPAGWAEIGVPGDPERRRHWAWFDAIQLAILAGRPSLFVTVGMVRPLMVSGQWREARRSVPELRLPDDIIGEGGTAPERVLEDLSYTEATVLCRLLGGRLPRERELDRVVAFLPAIADNPAPWQAWTADHWSFFGYSFAGWNRENRRWEALRAAPPAVESDRRTVLLHDGRRLRRGARHTSERAQIRAPVVFDA